MATREMRNWQITAFMEVLIPIQDRLRLRHGAYCIEKWREERLSRSDWDIL